MSINTLSLVRNIGLFFILCYSSFSRALPPEKRLRDDRPRIQARESCPEELRERALGFLEAIEDGDNRFVSAFLRRADPHLIRYATGPYFFRYHRHATNALDIALRSNNVFAVRALVQVIKQEPDLAGSILSTCFPFFLVNWQRNPNAAVLALRDIALLDKEIVKGLLGLEREDCLLIGTAVLGCMPLLNLLLNLVVEQPQSGNLVITHFNGWTALSTAAVQNEDALGELLRFAETHRDLWPQIFESPAHRSALHRAAEFGRTRAVSRLLDFAARYPEAIEFVLEGAPFCSYVRTRSESPLSLACANGHLEAIRTMLESPFFERLLGELRSLRWPENHEARRRTWLLVIRYLPRITMICEEPYNVEPGHLEAAVVGRDFGRVRELLAENASADPALLSDMLNNLRNFDRRQYEQFLADLTTLRHPNAETGSLTMLGAILGMPLVQPRILTAQQRATLDTLIDCLRNRLVSNQVTLALENLIARALPLNPMQDARFELAQLMEMQIDMNRISPGIRQFVPTAREMVVALYIQRLLRQ